MEQLRILLSKIVEAYNLPRGNEKSKIVSMLWTDYYKKSSDLGIKLDEAYNVYLLGEDESYIIEQDYIKKDISIEKVNVVLEKLKNSLSVNKEMRELVSGISMDEAKMLLDYDIYKFRNMINTFGINVDKCSFNGFCEIGQYASIKPFEEIGVTVTKNEAKTSFSYNLNHCFGTVRLPIKEDNTVVNKTFLIDPTYKQFFTSIRCNEGRYYAIDEDTSLSAHPDPGYFVSDIENARELIGNGYVLLTEESAEKYGEAFYYSSLSEEEASLRKESSINFYENIINSKLDYKYEHSEFDEIDCSFPGNNLIK